MGSTQFANFRGRLDIMKDQAIKQNEKKKGYEDKIQRISEKLEIANMYSECLDGIIRRLEALNAQYKQNRLDQINIETEKALQIVMPEENYKFKIDISPDNKKAELLIGSISENGDIYWCPPSQINGGFVQQLTVLSTITTIIMLMGSGLFWGDECLNAGDSKRLKDSSVLIERLCKNIQIVTIEHKDASFSKVPHRQILLRKKNVGKDAFAGYTELVSVSDFAPKQADFEGNPNNDDGNSFLASQDAYHIEQINID